MTCFRVSEADAGDFPKGRLAWDVLNRTACHEQSLPEEIDLSNCVMLKPYTLACLAALAAKSIARDSHCRLVLPRDSDCSDHCLRLGLHKWFDAPQVQSPEPRTTNVALRQLQGQPGGDFSNSVVELLVEKSSLPAGVLPRIETHLDEVVLNAVTHSESEVGCIVVGQGFPRKAVVEIAIVDLGIGIRSHLIKNPNHAHLVSDEQAIMHAVREGVTGTVGLNRWNGPNSGIGLHELVKYSQQGLAETTIISGSSICVFGKDSPITHSLRTAFPGCLVNIRFFL